MLKFLKTTIVIILLSFSINGWASLKLQEINSTDDARNIYSLYHQLNTWISEEEFLENFRQAKTCPYHLYKATVEEEKSVVGIIKVSIGAVKLI